MTSSKHFQGKAILISSTTKPLLIIAMYKMHWFCVGPIFHEMMKPKDLKPTLPRVSYCF